MTTTKGFDAFAGQLDYPMFVVTAASDGERDGCLVGFATQVSIHPARFLVCLSDKNRTFRVAQGAGRLAVHVVDRSHRELAELFGGETGDDTDKLERCRWSERDGAVVLDEAAAWFVGDVVDRVPFGDHEGFVLAPTSGGTREGGELDPVTFADVRHLEPGHRA